MRRSLSFENHGVGPSQNVIENNLVTDSAPDGIHLDAPGNVVTGNGANGNDERGISAIEGTTDGGGNTRSTTVNPHSAEALCAMGRENVGPSKDGAGRRLWKPWTVGLGDVALLACRSYFRHYLRLARVRKREGGTMPLYLSRFSYTPETWARLIGNPEDRRNAAQSYIESVGGKLHGFWYAFGTHDGYNLWEAPDNVSMAAVALAISGGGAASSFETAVLLTVDETMDALRKT